jgi:Domain of unknown function (DUF222)
VVAPSLGHMFDSVEQVEREDPFVLAAALAPLSRDDIEAMTTAQSEAVVVATQRVMSAMAARQEAAVETHVRRCEEAMQQRVDDARRTGQRAPHTSGAQVSAGTLAPLLRIAPRTAATRIRQARRLVCGLPGLHALAWAGDLERYRVAGVLRESEALAWEELAGFEARLLAHDLTETPGSQLRTRARRAAASASGSWLREQAATAAAQRCVQVGPGAVPGMSTWTVHLPTATSARLWSAVDALAAEYARANPALSVGAARADALTDLVEASATITTVVEIVTPAAGLPTGLGTGRQTSGPLTGLGTNRQTSCLGSTTTTETDETARPVGPVQADAAASAASGGPDETPREADTGEVDDPWPDHGAEEVAGGTLHWSGADVWFVPSLVEVPTLGALLPATVAALLADPDTAVRLSRSDLVTGAVRAQDPATYRPGAALARAVRSRDGTCRFPGCATPARRTQLDHVIPFPLGPTHPANLASLCATHHGFKHHAGWTLAMTTEGICTWTAPDGRTHTTWPLDRHGHAAA